MRSRSARPLALVLAAGACALAVFAQQGSSARGEDGGIFRISFSPGSGFDHVDPALSFTQPGWSLLDATCARLYTYPDLVPPAAFKPQPEVAARVEVSKDLRTYTFVLRQGFRFSNGEPVRASAFADAINRALQPAVRSPGAVYMRDIVGAVDVLAARRQTARGIVARRNTLVVRFTRPAPDFITRTTLPFFCAVPPGLPASAEGVGAFPSAGPYSVEEYRPGERVLIRRNKFYGGKRKIHVEGFDVDLQGGTPQDMLRAIDRGDADWGHTIAGVFMDPSLGLEAKYGINETRFWLEPGLTLRMLAINSSRPLFQENPRLRRAINFAIDRQALLPSSGGLTASRPTDQLLPHILAGFRDARIYPLERADLDKAMELARGSLRGAKAVLRSPVFSVATAQLVKQQLAAIGLEVTIEVVPDHIASASYLEKLTAPGAQWDLAIVIWTPNIPDAHAYLNLLLETQLVGGETLTRFRSKPYSRKLQQASLLQGPVRNRAYAQLDARITREAAPVVALSVIKEATLVSDRVGCMVLRPVLDLAVACLRE